MADEQGIGTTQGYRSGGGTQLSGGGQTLRNTMNSRVVANKADRSLEGLAKDLTKGTGVLVKAKSDLHDSMVRRTSIDLKNTYLARSGEIEGGLTSVEEKKQQQLALTLDMQETIANSNLDMEDPRTIEIVNKYYNDPTKLHAIGTNIGYDKQINIKALNNIETLADDTLTMSGTKTWSLDEYKRDNQLRLELGDTTDNELENKWATAVYATAEQDRFDNNDIFKGIKYKDYTKIYAPGYDDLSKDGQDKVRLGFQKIQDNFISRQRDNGNVFTNEVVGSIILDSTPINIKNQTTNIKNRQDISEVKRKELLNMLEVGSGRATRNASTSGKAYSKLIKDNVNGWVSSITNVKGFNTDEQTEAMYFEKLYNSDDMNLQTQNNLLESVNSKDNSSMVPGEKASLSTKINNMYKKQRDTMFGNISKDLAKIPMKSLSLTLNRKLYVRGRDTITTLGGSNTNNKKLEMGYALSSLPQERLALIQKDKWDQLENILQGGISDNELGIISSVDKQNAYNLGTDPREVDDIYEMNKALVFMGFETGEVTKMLKESFEGRSLLKEGWTGVGFDVKVKSKNVDIGKLKENESLKTIITGNILHLNAFHGNDISSAIDEYGVMIKDDADGNQRIYTRTKDTGFYDYIATVSKNNVGIFNILDMSANKYTSYERSLIQLNDNF